MSSCIYNTDSEWLGALRKNSIQHGANFWRKDQRRFHLPSGSFFYFKIRGTTLLAGRARFVRQVSMPVSEAWSQFGMGNGVQSEEELRRRASEVLGMEPSAELNCLLLDHIEILDQSQFVALEEGEFPPSIMAGKFFNDEEISRIESEFAERLPPQPPSLSDLTSEAASLEESGAFDPENINSAREKVFRAISNRRGQSGFRQRLLTAYAGKCAVTGCDAQEVLEAAHIVPYQGEETNVTANGILLRSDWHTLFDLGYWTITDDFRISISDSVRSADYRALHNKFISLPKKRPDLPSLGAIRIHRESSGSLRKSS